MRCDVSIDGVLVWSLWSADANVVIFEEEIGVDVRRDARIGLQDSLKVDVYKVVERVQVLLD